MITRLVLMLIRIKLGLKKYESFTFTNQKTSSIYWFTPTKLMKNERGITRPSTVSLNWLLDKECEIRIVIAR